MQQTALFIMGPTASGKTDLAIELANIFPIDIISVDSVMIYKGMNIGTSKPEPAILQKYPHALIDILEPHQSYSVNRFIMDAHKCIQQSFSQGRIPVLVGGTHLYFYSLLNGLASMPDTSLANRKLLQEKLDKIGSAKLHAELAKHDSISAARIHENDSQRILRALEVFITNNKPLSAYHASQTKNDNLNINILQIALDCPREDLRARIKQRFEVMLKQGLVNEVECLLENPKLKNDSPALRAVGYRQVLAYLNKQLSYDEMQSRGVISTCQLAKRQMTWLRKFNEVMWFSTQKHDTVAKIRDLLKYKLKTISLS